MLDGAMLKVKPHPIFWTEDILEEGGVAIDYTGVLRKAGWGVNHSKTLDHALDIVDAAHCELGNAKDP